MPTIDIEYPELEQLASSKLGNLEAETWKNLTIF